MNPLFNFNWLKALIGLKAQPSFGEKLTKVCNAIAHLELGPGEQYKIAQTSYNHGPVVITGGLLPQFVYTVFDESLMDFVEVTVQARSVTKIAWSAKIISSEDDTKGERLDTPNVKWYLNAFGQIVDTLSVYCPLYRERPTKWIG